jgi:hypothetical protein
MASEHHLDVGGHFLDTVALPTALHGTGGTMPTVSALRA